MHVTLGHLDDPHGPSGLPPVEVRELAVDARLLGIAGHLERDRGLGATRAAPVVVIGAARAGAERQRGGDHDRRRAAPHRAIHPAPLAGLSTARCASANASTGGTVATSAPASSTGTSVGPNWRRLLMPIGSVAFAVSNR